METGAVEHAIVIEDGDVLELDKNDARKKDKVTAGRILIDSGSSIDVVEELVIRDRRILSEDGIVLAVAGHQQAHRQGATVSPKW
jgi:ribonuclease J